KDSPSSVGSIYVLDGAQLRALLRDHFFDLFGGSQAELDALLLNYEFVDYFVAGSYDTPNFIDPDDGTWHVNYKTGDYRVGHDKVTWLLSVPRQTPSHQAPFPMQMHIHGYTSSRLEGILWAGTFCRFGMATLTIDAWGHGGATFDNDQLAGLTILLAQYGMKNAAKGIFNEGRARDLNGDGKKDNGGDFWSADLFHTRDVVRQTAVDAMQGLRIFRECDGVKTWPFDLNGSGHPMIACDFNGDGIPDTGGPFNTYDVVGGSLGGILTGVIGPVEPTISMATEVSGGAGLADIGTRSTIGNVNDAVLARVFGPIFLTYMDSASSQMTMGFEVPDVTDHLVVPVHALPAEAQPGDRIELTNLRTGKMRWSILAADLTSRIELGADAGDPMDIVIRQGGLSTAPVRVRVDKLDRVEKYQQKKWAVGTPIVAPTEGWGMKRQTPDLRRFFSIGAIVTEPADPVSYARGWFLDPFEVKPHGKRYKNVMMVPTLGDNSVPVGTEVALARAAGLIPVTAADARNPDIRYGRGPAWTDGMTFDEYYAQKLTWDEWRTKVGTNWAPDSADLAPNPNAVFLRNFVIEGLSRLRRFELDPRYLNSQETLFDIDDLSDGTDGFGQPRISEPMRILRRTPAGISAVRLPFLSPQGQHGFGFYEPDLPFDMPSYMHALLGHFGDTKGKELIDAPCNAKEDCSFIPGPIFDPGSIHVPAAVAAP
ncbi:MAG TPA: hypothetical protein VMV18_13180, partial [bacterium]|nr:hypothetical protein [bacterium]